MLSHVVGLSTGDLPGLRPRAVLKTAFWLQNGPWRSSVLETNRQAENKRVISITTIS